MAEPVPLADRALDALGTLLRLYGKYAFDLDGDDARSVSQRCERWARRVLIGASSQDEPPAKGASALDERDWNGLRDFFGELRRKEHEYVTGNFRNFREVVGVFVEALRTAFAEDEASDAQVLALVVRLRAVLEDPSTQRLRREASDVVGQLGRLVEERTQRHRKQMKQLGDRLRVLRAELNEARREMALDPLTRLYNRSALEEHLARTVELSQLSGQPACLLRVDADHFKAINDRYGHPFGDALLRELADCCTRNFPRRNDFVARYGGEEYAIVLQDTPLAIARSLGRRLLEAVESLRFVHEGETLTITVSIGIAELGSRDDASSWIGGADQALYQAKRAGRNQVAERPIAAPATSRR